MSGAFADWLLVHAAPVEADGLQDLAPVQLGVGKTAAALELYATLLAQETRRTVPGVLLFGVAGAFPDRHRPAAAPVRLGEVCVVGSDYLGDEGVETAAGFWDLAHLQLGEVGPFPANGRIAEQAATCLQAPIVQGVTVSSCSGSEAGSRRMFERCCADVETMEGAAVALVCRRRELPLLHVRAISNWTGDRDRGGWDLPRAAAAVQAAVRRLCGQG